jgi:hypothetical protein
MLAVALLDGKRKTTHDEAHERKVVPKSRQFDTPTLTSYSSHSSKQSKVSIASSINQSQSMHNFHHKRHARPHETVKTADPSHPISSLQLVHHTLAQHDLVAIVQLLKSRIRFLVTELLVSTSKACVDGCY